MPLTTKICKECGQPFEPTTPWDKYCSRDHYRICQNCGKPYFVPKDKLSNFTKKTCSEECRRALISKNSASKIPRFDCICEICGKHFKSSSPNARVCDDKHYRTCIVCGKVFELNHQQALGGTQTCSDECRYKLAHQTYDRNYGKSTNPEGHRQLISKFQQTCLDKYGVDNPLKVEEFKHKSEVTNLKKYGVAHFPQSNLFIQRSIDTNLKRYGKEWHAQTDDHKQSIVDTCMKKYGVSNAGKYGAFIVDKMTDPSKLNDLISFRTDPARYIQSNFEHPPTLFELSQCLGIRDSSVGWILANCNLMDLVSQSFSNMENDVVDFLKSLDSSIVLERNTRKIITPYEIDIYLPDFKIGIECNPTATHNSTNTIFQDKGEKPVSPSYHKMKSDLCEASGNFLLHLFGYEWNHKRNILESMIINLLGRTPNKVYARNTQVVDLSNSDAKEFLDQNHRQGYSVAPVRLGLISKTSESLLSVMTFSHPRNTIGKLDSNSWELVRFCNTLNTNVVGGASKLLSYFIQHYSPASIVSFSDRAHTRGTLYKKLGFHEVRRSDPGYVWVNEKTDFAYSRLNAQKSNICKFLHDDSLDLSRSEFDLMESHGYVRVYDSGTITWKLDLKGG